jgi:hypothetical protein
VLSLSMHIPVTRDNLRHDGKWDRPLKRFSNPLTPLQASERSNDPVGWLFDCSHIQNVYYALSECITLEKEQS